MSDLTVTADIPSDQDLLGKTAAQLQENISLENGAATGTSKYVTGYTGFSGDPALQSGNYIALKLTAPAADSIKVGFGTAETLIGDDGLLVVRVTGKTDQPLTVTVTRGQTSASVSYDLSGLTLQEGDET